MASGGPSSTCDHHELRKEKYQVSLLAFGLFPNDPILMIKVRILGFLLDLLEQPSASTALVSEA